MNARYEAGELVDIAVRGRVVNLYPSIRQNADGSRVEHQGLVVDYTDGGERSLHVWMDVPSVTVSRVAPVEWPPQTGDVWRDRNGATWFDNNSAAAAQIGERWLVGTDGRGERAGMLLSSAGPLSLVYREGWSPQPAVPVAPADLLHCGKCEDQADEPVDERAAMAAGLRQLADLIEAHPDLPVVAHQLGASVYPNNMPHIGNDDALGFAELRRIAAILGVEPDLRDEPGAPHPTARLRLAGGVAYEATYITEAYKRAYKPVEPEPVVDGSPSDLDGPPEPCGNDWHFGANRPRFGSCPACGEAPSTPDGIGIGYLVDADEPVEPAAFDGVHEAAGGRAGGPGACAAWCACGTTFDGFDTHREAAQWLATHIAVENGEPIPSTPDGGDQS